MFGILFPSLSFCHSCWNSLEVFPIGKVTVAMPFDEVMMLAPSMEPMVVD